VTGIGEATIEELATAHGTERGAAIHVSTGVNQGSAGAIAYYLAQVIHFVTGNLDRAGGVLVAKSLVDITRLAQIAGIDASSHRSRVGGFAPVMGTLPATILPDEILTEGEGRIRALIVTAGNPALSCANSARMQKALSKLELLVTLDLYRNETSELGHFALPALDFFQREDLPLPFLTFQPEPYLQWTEAVAKPLGEERSEWDVFVDLSLASGFAFSGVPGLARTLAASRRLGDADPFAPRRALDAMLRLAGTSLAELKRAPHGVLREPNREGTFLGSRVLTEDGRVDLGPALLVQGLRKLDAMRRERLARTEKGTRLMLFSKREKTSHNSWMHNVPELVRGRRNTNYAYLNPDDASARGITDGARVRVSNEWGSIELPARLDEDVMPGAIAIPHGWGHARAASLTTAKATLGADVNQLAPDGPLHTDPIAGMTQLVGIPVGVELVSL
jgi:anaerobic selenocysteine-containing dehydrogenase